MMEKELTPQGLGENKGKQWYELYPERLKEEIELMRSAFPNMTLYHKPGENISWSGRIACYRKDGSELYGLEVRIECPCDYPIAFPAVFDVNKVLAEKGCPHLHDSKESICYGNRLDLSLDFTRKTRVKDLAGYIAEFLARQWYFEHYGDWIDGQLHGVLAFLKHELKSGPIDKSDLCPCGQNSSKYENCCIPRVRGVLQGMKQCVEHRFEISDLQKIEKDSPCPCGKKKKNGQFRVFRKCCKRGLNFPSNEVFNFLRFPEYYGFSKSEVDDFLIECEEIFLCKHQNSLMGIFFNISQNLFVLMITIVCRIKIYVKYTKVSVYEK